MTEQIIYTMKGVGKVVPPKREILKDIYLSFYYGAKIGILRLNGSGKSTLLRIMAGVDTDFIGEVLPSKGYTIGLLEQEPQLDPTKTVQQIVEEGAGKTVVLLKEYERINNRFSENPSPEEMEKLINQQAEVQEKLEKLNAWDLQSQLDLAMDALRCPPGDALVAKLSGGEKRRVALCRLLIQEPDILLLDEPTNHLDYHGKGLFLDWLRALKTACCIISHDRDVLAEVDSIVEIRDYQAFVYPGNYDSYIRQNGTNTVTQVNQYEAALKRLGTLHAQLQLANARKAGAANSRPRILADRLQRDYDALKDNLEKPSFWIDRQTTETLGKDIVESYDRYKAKTITLGTTVKDRHKHELVSINKLSIGYSTVLFDPISFRLEHGDRLVLRGRNGAGKSTLVNAILAAARATPTEIKHFSGEIKTSTNLRVGVYEQEIASRYLALPLGEAVNQIYRDAGLAMNDQILHSILSRYLFEPARDKNLEVRKLSGGQKARFQLICMLATNPNLLILDEPTNHLDLPSVEELEDAILAYPGAVICVSHDSHFIDRIGGQVVQIGHV